MSLATARSLLFAPGHEERKLQKALAAGADAVVADLEDAVPAGEKEVAREVASRVVREASGGSLVALRMNGVGTPHWEGDREAASALELDALVLPKATPEAVVALGPDGPPVVAIVETALGVRQAYETATLPRVAALVLGAVDLGAELGLEARPDGLEVLYARSRLVLDSAAAGIRNPFDIVHLDIRDDDGLEAEALLARSLGFRGKACIHPAQIEIVNRVFSPTKEEQERARRVIEAYEHALEDGRGVVALDGEMIDLPVVERARRILAETERSVPE
jgi:citrate lyase beta subunit